MWNVLPQLKNLLMFQQNAKFYCSKARSTYIYEKLPEADVRYYESYNIVLRIHFTSFLRLEYSCAHIFTYPDNFAMLLQLDSILNSSFQNKDVACGVVASLRYACIAKFSFLFFLLYNGDRYIGTTVLFVTFDPVSS